MQSSATQCFSEQLNLSRSNFNSLMVTRQGQALPAGFEPARGDPNGFQVHRLDHSATTTPHPLLNAPPPLTAVRTWSLPTKQKVTGTPLVKEIVSLRSRRIAQQGRWKVKSPEVCHVSPQRLLCCIIMGSVYVILASECLLL